jgi:very-short-patch-repair endonuclease
MATARDYEALRRATRRCGQKAERQAGAISHHQAIACGLSPRSLHSRTKSGLFVRVLPSTYVFGGTPDCWEQRLWTAHLWARGNSVFSHLTAAVLLGFPGFAKSPVEMILKIRKASPRAWLKIHSATKLRAEDVTRIGRFPVTTATRTLLDLGGVVTEESLEIALDHALVRNLTSRARLNKILIESGGRGCKGAGPLRHLLRVRGDAPPCASPLETKTARFLREFRFPSPARQHVVADRGRFVARADFAYPDRRMVIEVDSLRWHASRKRWEADRHRLNDLAVAGWAPFHILSSRLRDDREALARELWEVYGSRPRFPTD